MLGRWLGEAAACVPEPAVLPALHQPLPGRRVRQLLLHHAGHGGRRHGRAQRVSVSARASASASPAWATLCALSVPGAHCGTVLPGPALTVCPARSFHSLVIDVTMALDTLSLPVLEPLTPTRLQDVTVLALSCLYAGEWIPSSFLELLALLCYLHVGGSAHK